MEERNLELILPQEGIREKISSTNVIRFYLDEIESHFDENLQYIISQFNIADELIQNKRLEDARNIWSSQIVFLESAFDFYLHELTKYGLSEMFAGNWEKTDKYCNLSVQMSIVDRALNSREDTDWFLDFVNAFYREITLVSYKSVKDQMNLLGLNLQELADAVFYEVDSKIKTKDKLKACLDSLYNKRNVIAHQSGRRHSDAQKEIITKDMVEKYIEAIDKVVRKIQELAREKG